MSDRFCFSTPLWVIVLIFMGFLEDMSLVKHSFGDGPWVQLDALSIPQTSTQGLAPTFTHVHVPTLLKLVRYNETT